HSMGGFIAQLASIQRPDWVMSFTSISSHTASPRVPSPPRRTWEVMLANHPVGELLPDLPGYMGVWRYLNGDVPFDEEAAAEYTRELHSRNPKTLPATNHVAIQQGMEDRTPALANTGVPGLAIHGDCDLLVPVEGGLITADALPVSRLAVLPGAGHMLFNRGAWTKMLDELAENLACAPTA
ncbi:MAG: alpha/beta hydrolase, partial [Lysobacterales bacterium]